MRFPLAAMIFVALLFVAGVGYAVTSFVLSEIETELTKPSSLTLLGSNSDEFQENLEGINLVFGVAFVIFFIFLVVAFVVDALRYEDEVYYPPGGYNR